MLIRGFFDHTFCMGLFFNLSWLQPSLPKCVNITLSNNKVRDLQKTLHHNKHFALRVDHGHRE